MANYISRVELHAANADDYQKLHGSMERKGFSRLIKADNGVLYWLPTGTYDVANTSASLNQAIEAAKAAATETGKTFSLIVSERNAATWDGLTRKG